MRLAPALLLALGAACTRAEPAAPPAPVPTPPAPARRKPPPPPQALPTCATAQADGSNVDGAVIAGDVVALCHGQDATRSCWTFDLAAGTVTPRAPNAPPPARPVPPVAPTATVNDDGTVQICPTGPASCAAFTPRRKADINGGVSVSADGTLVAVGNASQTSIDVYEVASGKKRVTLKSWNTAMGRPAPLDAPTFAGDRLIMWAHATPVSAAARIYDLKGRKLAAVGGKDFTSNPDLAFHVDGSQWAIKQLDGPTLIVVDVKTGKQVRKFDLRKLAAAAPPPGDMLRLYEIGATATRGDQIVYVTADGTPVVGLLDRKTGGAVVLAPPRCP